MIVKGELFYETKMKALKDSVKANCYLKKKCSDELKAIVTDWEEII